MKYYYAIMLMLIPLALLTIYIRYRLDFISSLLVGMWAVEHWFTDLHKLEGHWNK